MRFVFYFLLLTAIFSTNCGGNGNGKTPCDEAREVQKQMCEGSERCFPCVCILNDEEPFWIDDGQGLPDLTASYCIDPSSCTGHALDVAIDCIENERTCDPSFYKGMLLFRDGVPVAAFPNACDF